MISFLIVSAFMTFWHFTWSDPTLVELLTHKRGNWFTYLLLNAYAVCGVLALFMDLSQ